MCFFVTLQYEAEPMQEKGLSLGGRRFISQSCFSVLYLELTVHDCFVLNSKSCGTVVMHRLLPVGSNNIQSLYNLNLCVDIR